MFTNKIGPTKNFSTQAPKKGKGKLLALGARKRASSKKMGISGTHARVAIEVMVAVQNGTLFRALRVLLKRRGHARRGGDCGLLRSPSGDPVEESLTCEE